MTDNANRSEFWHSLQHVPENVRDIAARLHELATAHGCRHHLEPRGHQGSYRVHYSAMGLTVTIEGEDVTLSTQYDIRAFLDFYRHSAGEATRELLFPAATACCFCIDDKCTTLLTDRRIRLGEQVKQLCGPYRHGLKLPVTPANIGLMAAIYAMIFRYCTPEMHAARYYENDATYRVEARGEMCVVGYRHISSQLSVRTEQFIQECLAQDGNGRTKLDELAGLTGQPAGGPYVGVTRDFVDGLSYTYVLGIPCAPERLPETLPDGVEAVRLGAGEYALYNSAGGDYPGIWRHFKDRFFDAEHKGYDTSRPRFECFHRDGRLYDVGIPVAAGLPKESGRRSRVVRTPDITIAGYQVWAETDFPLHRDVPDRDARVRALFPNAERYVGTSMHAKPGQPMCHKSGVEVDRLDVIPEGLEVMTLRGGLWHVISYPYPAPADWVLELPYRTRCEVDNLHHPREFIEMEYNGRGAYSEIYVPIRIVGQRVVELAERPECRLIGKQVALPERPVSDADVDRFYRLEANPEKGSYTLAFRFEKHNGQLFFAPPIIKGVEVASFDDVPEGLETFTLAGGEYVRITETVPNGELDWWTMVWPLRLMQKETGHEPDLSRPVLVHQTGYGREFALYIPVK